MPPPISHGMAEKIIKAEPGASAGRPGRGRAEADANLKPMNKVVAGIKTKNNINNPQLICVCARCRSKMKIKAANNKTHTTQPAGVGDAGNGMPARSVTMNSISQIITVPQVSF